MSEQKVIVSGHIFRLPAAGGSLRYALPPIPDVAPHGLACAAWPALRYHLHPHHQHALSAVALTGREGSRP